MPVESRRTILMLAKRAGVIVVENDLYGELRYHGAEVPTIKRLDESGETILLGSFSKIAFPGLRVGWAIGPAALHRAADGSQGSERSAFGSALAGRAAAVRGVGTAGGASAENADRRERSG